MVIAILMESDTMLSDELLESILDKVWVEMKNTALFIFEPFEVSNTCNILEDIC